MMANGRRFVALVRKELIQFLRARILLALVLYLYTGEVLMCTYSMSFDVRNLSTVVADFDRSAQSRRLLQGFASSGYFEFTSTEARERDMAHALDRGTALAAVIVPKGVSAQLVRGEPVAIQLLLDGSNANTASVAQGYARRIVQDFALEEARALGAAPDILIEHRPRVWYNSELEYSYFTVLSMISLAGMMVGVLLAAAGLVREKESGTVEQLLVTPASSAEVIAAKLVPPLVMGLFALFPSLVVAAAVGVPAHGSVALFFMFTVVFLLSSMGIGILIATAAETLQQALLMSFLLLLPLLFLSGTVVPLESMPVWLQYLAELSPLRHYMDVVLGIFFKGVGIEILWPRLAAMTAIGVALLALGIGRFRRHLA